MKLSCYMLRNIAVTNKTKLNNLSILFLNAWYGKELEENNE